MFKRLEKIMIKNIIDPSTDFFKDTAVSQALIRCGSATFVEGFGSFLASLGAA